MNFVFLSPHFPPNYYLFCVHLRRFGANVLGLADEPYENLRPDLRDALTEYYRVYDLHDYDSLLRALGYFTHRYGKLNGLDSQNEYWLETEARLRSDFNIPGLNIQQIAKVKKKSEMKKQFIKAGVAVAKGKVVYTLAQARQFVSEVGYPLVAKPDVGVGAAKTYKINNEEDLEFFWRDKLPAPYLLEEFVSGQIFTFDGLVDQNGQIVFYTSHVYSQGIMETVNEDRDIYYFSLRQIPSDLEMAGRAIVRVYKLKARFFHFEFFRTPDGKLIALEVNMRPPGGLTTDMFNYANDTDVYREWANIIVNNRFEGRNDRPYHCAYVGRKNSKSYQHSHQEILSELGEAVVHHEAISGVFSAALGDYGYLIRSPDLGEIERMAAFIQEKEV
ncbi:MAG: ATP-grasp domain-containing protein [Anaerolineales bacterium]|nr:ATP-grasp domain-containing protein [Anaerolineales bacterium]